MDGKTNVVLRVRGQEMARGGGSSEAAKHRELGEASPVAVTEELRHMVAPKQHERRQFPGESS